MPIRIFSSTIHIGDDRLRRRGSHSPTFVLSKCIHAKSTRRESFLFLFSFLMTSHPQEVGILLTIFIFVCPLRQVVAHSMSRAQRRPSSMPWKSSYLATIQRRSSRKSKSNRICRRCAIGYSNRANRSTVAANAASIPRVCCASIASNSRPIVCTNTKLAHRRVMDAVIVATAKHGNGIVIVMNTR